MEFNLPTTKEQMYVILKDLFYYYRIRRQGYEEVLLEEMELERLEVNLPTDEQIAITAKTLLEAKHEREKNEYNAKISSEIKEIESLIASRENSLSSQIDAVEELYAESITKIEQQAIKAGLMNSSVIVDKTAGLLDSKNAKIAEINAEHNFAVAQLNAKKQALENLLLESQSYFDGVFRKDENEKIVELTEKREQLRIEVFKYNNALDEKEQRYKNTLKQTRASLQLRFLDISSGEFTKDQLVEMGYYKDVIRCVSGYYNTLEPLTAFQDITNERNLAIYLDDYYSNVVYSYKVAAGY